MDFALSFTRPDGDELKEKLGDWDASGFKSYRFSVPNFDAADLPSHFDPSDCSPVDEEALQKREIEKLRNK